MLDKITVTIKDLVVYFIPGIFTLFSLIYLIGYDLKKLGILDNTSLAVLSIIFSFLFGFIISQVQIILFYKVVSEDEHLKLSNCSIPIEFKNKIAEQIKSVFGLNPELDIQIILDAPKILSLCDNYVRIKGNAESYSPIERDGYLSSFSIVIFLPTILGLISYVKSLKDSFHWWENFTLSTIFILLISFLLFITVRKAAINFKRGKTCKTFEQFLVHSIRVETSKASG